MADHAEAPGADNADETNAETPADAGQAQESGAEGAQDDDFGSAFDEAVAGLAPAKSSDTKEDEPPAETGDDEEGRAEQAPPKSGAETPPAPAPGEKPAAGTTLPDILKDASPEVRKFFEDQAAEVERNRKRAEGLERRVRGFTKSATPAPSAPKSEDEKRAEAERQSKLDEQIDALGKDFPEIAGPILELMKAQSQRIDQLSGAVTPITEASQQEALHEATEELKGLHSDFMAYGNPGDDADYAKWLKAQTPQVQQVNQLFREWIEAQPPGIRRLDGSWDPKENGILISLFKTSTGSASPTTTGDAPGGTQTVTATDERRRRQMAGGADVRSRAAPVAAGAPDDDFGAAFEEAGKKFKSR